MNQTRTELIVGIFVLIGIACLGYLAIRLGKLEILGSGGYVVYADFASVAGLKLGDSVEIAGVKIGKVETITLADDRGRLGQGEREIGGEGAVCEAPHTVRPEQCHRRINASSTGEPCAPS